MNQVNSYQVQQEYSSKHKETVPTKETDVKMQTANFAKKTGQD